MIRMVMMTIVNFDMINNGGEELEGEWWILKEGVWGVQKDPIIGGAPCPQVIRLKFYGRDRTFLS